MENSEECIFCKISRGEIKSEKIYENDNFFSILDRNQEIKGHTLVISKKHFINTLDMPSSLGQEFFDCIKNSSIILMKRHAANGFNVVGNNFGAAGQVVMHLHYHILPRENGVDVGKIY